MLRSSVPYGAAGIDDARRQLVLAVFQVDAAPLAHRERAGLVELHAVEIQRIHQRAIDAQLDRRVRRMGDGDADAGNGRQHIRPRQDPAGCRRQAFDVDGFLELTRGSPGGRRQECLQVLGRALPASHGADGRRRGACGGGGQHFGRHLLIPTDADLDAPVARQCRGILARIDRFIRPESAGDDRLVFNVQHARQVLGHRLGTGERQRVVVGEPALIARGDRLAVRMTHGFDLHVATPTPLRRDLVQRLAIRRLRVRR